MSEGGGATGALMRSASSRGISDPPPAVGANANARDRYNAERAAHSDAVARRGDRWRRAGGAYHRRVERIYRLLIAPGQRVLEIGCGAGDLLAAVEPGVGVGVDFSPEMVRRAAERHPGLRFIEADAHQLSQLGERFDVIILSEVVNDLWDVQKVLEEVRALCTPRTRVILNFYSHLWEPPLRLAQRLGLMRPTLALNWLTIPDVTNFLGLAGFEVIRRWEEVLLPLPVPLLASLCNRFLVRFWPFKLFHLSHFVLARPVAEPDRRGKEPLVSVVVPARNEAGNIRSIFERTPEMGSGTELIFVEGHSKDDTLATIEREIAAHPERRARVLRQQGVGKGDAVRLGFADAQGEVLMILDADLTVAPEDLPRFYDVLRKGAGEFVNGVRLVYPMEKQAMRSLNLIGNKFFSLAFSWLIGQPIKDTLCGTKVLPRSEYQRIAANRSYFGDFDPFGDFDLLFGAAKLGLKLVEVPIRYRERTYGTTNIQRWRHGWLLVRMSAFAAARLKFV
jgi:SAM-dependent methyltransferase